MGPQPPPILAYADPLEESVHRGVLMEERGDGVAFMIRPSGLFREAGALFVLGAISLALLVGGMVFVLTALDERDAAWLLGAGLFFAVLLMLLVMIVSIYRTATRATTLEVREGRLILTSAAALFRPTRSWPIEEIRSLRVAWRGVFVGDLEMMRHGARPVLLLAGRRRSELRWMVRSLNAALHLQD